MPSTASDVLAPLSQKTRPLIPLLRTGSLTSPLDLSAPQTQTARRFMTLPKRLSVNLPSEVPTTNEGPASSQESRVLGMQIDVSPSFFGTCFLRVMSRLRWRDTQLRRRTATPIPEDGDILVGLGTQRTDAISIKTQKVRANRNMRDVMKVRQRGHHNRTFGTDSSTC